MSTLLHWFTSPEWAQIVKALLHSLWQGALIALALAVFMRRLANPVLRYRCSIAALACVVVAGIITWAVINSSEERTPSPVQNQPTAENQNAHNFAATMDASPEDKIIVTANRTPAATSMRWTAWLALVWLAGAGVMLARAGVKVAGAERLRRSCQPLNDARVEKLLAKARRAIGLARQVRVGVTDKLTSPAVVGVFVPMLILPLSLLTTLTPEQIHFVLLHELAHIRRGDYLANLFQFFAESLLFFNPAVWWISHQVRREREACCDALAIELSGAPVDYARTLVHVAENMLQPAPAAALAFGDKREPSSLIDRVQRLLVPGYRPSLRLTWRAMLAALVLGSVLLVLSAVGTRMTVAAILTPQQRIEKIEKKMTEYGEKPEVESTTPHSKNAPKVEVSGRVRMADGSALPKIKWVNIYTERKNYGGVSSARPSTNGMFSTTVSSGRICAGVEIPGFAPVVAGPVDATGTNRVENLDLVLDRGFDAPIEITDAETGKPISGAIVKAQFWVREMGVGIGTSRELKTDATGTATMTPCSDSVALTLIVNASGYEIVEQRIEKLKPQEAIRFKLQRGLSRSGVVLNKADNSPLEGATVRMIYERGRKEQRYEWTDEARVLAKTDAAGRFTVNQLQRGTQYWLGVSAPGHESVLVGPVMAGASDLAMQLGPEIIVRGRVIGSLEGLQIINKDYCLSRNYSEVFDDHSNGFQQWLPVRVTDGVATFQFTNPIPGRVTLSDRQGFHQERDVTAPVDDWVVDLTEREKTNAPVMKREVVFRFKHPSAVPPRGTVSVTIPDSLEINHLTAHSVELEITNGEVRAEIAIGGRTSIEAKHMVGYWFNRFGERGSLLSIEVTNGTGPLVIEIPLVPAGAIYAKARNDDGTPAGGLMFGLSELERALGVDKSSLIGGDSDGFSGDAPRKWVSGPLPLGGTYQIYGWRGNMFCMSRPVKLTEANPDAEVELQFPPGKTFDGVVLDADGKPLRDLVLNPEFILAGNHSFALKSVFTDERGCFRIENMTPELGEYSVVVAAPGLMAEIMKPDFGSQPQTIRLQRGRTLAGRVVQAGTGYAVPNAELRAQDFDHNKLPGQTTRTDADGRFEFTTLGDANYTLYVSDGQLSSDKKFRADGNTNVTLAVKLYGWSKLKPKPPVIATNAALTTMPATNAINSDTNGLFTRMFNVDPNVFLSNLSKQTGLTSTNAEEEIKALQKLFSDAGADLQPTNKAVFYNDRNGTLFVRVTLKDLDAIESAIQKLNYAPPLISIKIKFIAVPDQGTGDLFLGTLGSNSVSSMSSPETPVPPVGNNSSNGEPLLTSGLRMRSADTTSTLTGILTPAQARQVLQALESNPNAKVIATPSVTTANGRQAQIQIVDVMTIVKGINPQALTPPGITTTNEAEIYKMEEMRFGPVIDLIPYLSEDGYTIQLTAIPSVTEFLGYDKPTNSVTVYVNGKKQSVQPPLPHIHTQKISSSVVVFDGDTLVLGGLVSEEVSKVKDKTPILGDLPLVGSAFRSESSTTTKKKVLVFITPTLVDPAGNRLHTDEDMPFTQNGVSVQAK